METGCQLSLLQPRESGEKGVTPAGSQASGGTPVRRWALDALAPKSENQAEGLLKGLRQISDTAVTLASPRG